MRSGPSSEDKILGVLILNDQVYLPTGEVYNGFVEIEVVKSKSEIANSPTGKYYVGYKYISSKPRVQTESHKYFMIQNLATETLRVYKKICDSNGDCYNKMLVEAGIAVGEPNLTPTIAGSFNIVSWRKFYQDHDGLYPSWYHPDYPMPPKAGKGPVAWTKKKYLPYEEASVRGAFGWYTAKIGPNAESQWTHGTLGWGADKKKYINVTRGLFANLFTDPRSHGCSRTDNETIAYVRQLLPKGAPIIKVYAKEAYAIPSNETNNENNEWNYILTKNSSQKSDRSEVVASKTPDEQWLEEGTYQVDSTPNAKPFLEGDKGAKSGKTGNVYGLNHDHMHGVYLVDKGLLINYKHPSKILVGGYRDQLFPHFVLGNSSINVEMPACPKKKLSSGGRRGSRPAKINKRCSYEYSI